MIPSIITDIEYSPSKEVTFVRCKPSRPFEFKEGQFMMVRSDHIHTGLGRPLKKAYSIATTNEELQTKGTIGYVVKKTCDGFMSEHLTEKIHVGDLVHLTGPAGHMRDSQPTDAYLLMSVGSGLSPMVALYQAISVHRPHARIVNLFGERYHKNVLPSVEKLFSEQTENIKNILFLSRDDQLTTPSDVAYRQGYVQSAIPEALAFLGKGEINAFLCGKPEMVNDAKQQLIDVGIDPKRIKAEKY